MATQSKSNVVEVQKLIAGAARLELKFLNAGVEAMQVYIDQASRLSSLASETLQAMQDDKATLSGTAHKLTEFGRQNAQAFSNLAQRLSASYFDEIDRMATVVRDASAETKPAAAATEATEPIAARKPRRRSAARRG